MARSTNFAMHHKVKVSMDSTRIECSLHFCIWLWESGSFLIFVNKYSYGGVNQLLQAWFTWVLVSMSSSIPFVADIATCHMESERIIMLENMQYLSWYPNIRLDLFRSRMRLNFLGS